MESKTIIQDKNGLQQAKQESDIFLWIKAFLFAGICYIIFSLTGELYADNDNLMISVVTNGLYGKDFFCQYLHPLLCVIINCISRVFPMADAFLIVTDAGVFLELSVLTYVSLRKMPEKSFFTWYIQEYISGAVLVSGLIFLSVAINIWSINYTAQTASFVFAGLIGLFEYRMYTRICKGESDEADLKKASEDTSLQVCRKKKSHMLYVFSVILISLGFMMRIEAALIFIPYIMLNFISEAFAFRTCREEKMQKKIILTHLETLAPCVVIVALLMISRFVFWSIEPHASSQRYNEARTITGDFQMKDWKDVEDVIEDTDYTEYESPIVWSIFDTEVITTEKMQYIAEVGSEFRYPFTKTGWHFALKEMKQRLFRSDLQLLLMFIAACLLLARNLFLMESIVLKIESVLSFIGSFIILLYFTFKGRAPLRIWQPVIFAAVAVLLLSAMSDHLLIQLSCEKEGHLSVRKQKVHDHSFGNSVFMLLVFIVLYFSIGQVIATGSWHKPMNPFAVRTDVEDPDYKKSFSNDSLFIWPEWWKTVAGDYVIKGCLPSRQVLEHNIPLAYWTYGQVYFNEFLDDIDVPNPARALLERPNTYLVEGMEEFVLEYMQVHYGKDLELERAGTINGYKYYRLVRNPDM